MNKKYLILSALAIVLISSFAVVVYHDTQNSPGIPSDIEDDRLEGEVGHIDASDLTVTNGTEGPEERAGVIDANDFMLVNRTEVD